MRLRLAILCLAVSACRTEPLPPPGDGSPRDGGAVDLAVQDRPPVDAARVDCKSLDLDGCHAQPACKVVSCPGCGCTPLYACVAAGDPPPQCPALGCAAPQCCRSANDCSPPGFSFCSIPPLPPSCGVCFTGGDSSCATDTDCTPGEICDPQPCSCGSPAPLACRPGCTADGDCQEPQRCGSDHRCHARPCDATCKGPYACAPDGTSCVRRACKADADCGTEAFCVEGQCARSLGMCWQPAA